MIFLGVSLVKDIDKSNKELSKYIYRFCQNWIHVKWENFWDLRFRSKSLWYNNLVPFPLKRGLHPSPAKSNVINPASTTVPKENIWIHHSPWKTFKVKKLHKKSHGSKFWPPRGTLENQKHLHRECLQIGMPNTGHKHPKNYTIDRTIRYSAEKTNSAVQKAAIMGNVPVTFFTSWC